MDLRRQCVAAAILVLGGCATDGGDPMTSQRDTQAVAGANSASGGASAATSATSKPAAPVATGPLVFNDLPAFDRALSQSLSNAKTPVVVTSADRITLRQIPPRLEKWLAAVDDSGGKIETVPVDGQEQQTRSLGLIFALIGAIRQAREFAKDHIYADARHFDAKIFYKLDASGDRVMDRVELVRRAR